MPEMYVDKMALKNKMHQN